MILRREVSVHYQQNAKLICHNCGNRERSRFVLEGSSQSRDNCREQTLVAIRFLRNASGMTRNAVIALCEDIMSQKVFSVVGANFLFYFSFLLRQSAHNHVVSRRDCNTAFPSLKKLLSLNGWYSNLKITYNLLINCVRLECLQIFQIFVMLFVYLHIDLLHRSLLSLVNDRSIKQIHRQN